MLTPIAFVEILATFLWCFAGLAALDWVGQVRRLEQRAHIPAVADLLLHLVPAMVGLVVIVLVGALVGLPSVVVFIAVLFPAGLAYGISAAVIDMDNDAPDWSRLARRAVAAALLAGILATWRLYG